MNRRALLRRLAPLALAWALLAMLVARFAVPLLVAAAPPLQWAVEHIVPGVVVTVLAAAPGDPAGDLTIVLRATQPLPIAGDRQIAPWIPIAEQIHAGHDLQGAILVFSVLLAWPYRRPAQAARALALALPLCAALLMWTIPVHMAGLFELRLQAVAAYFHQHRPEPWYLAQMIFFESGGVWMLALLEALAIGALVTRDRSATRAGAALPAGAAVQDQAVSS